jgi:hypothetical protein
MLATLASTSELGQASFSTTATLNPYLHEKEYSEPEQRNQSFRAKCHEMVSLMHPGCLDRDHAAKHVQSEPSTPRLAGSMSTSRKQSTFFPDLSVIIDDSCQLPVLGFLTSFIS